MLDLGEAEAIALAVECAPSLLLIDERDGRQVARTLGVPLTAPWAYCYAPRPLAHTRDQAPFGGVDRQHHFRLHPDLVRHVIAEAGEAT